MLLLAALFFSSFLVYGLFNVVAELGSLLHIGVFIGLPALGLGGSLFCFRLSPENRLIVAFSALSAICALYAAEYVLQRQSSTANALPAGIESRNSADVIGELRAKGFDASRRLAPRSLLVEAENGEMRSRLTHDGREFLPLAGIAGQSVVHCRESGPWVTYRADRHGFNNPSGAWDELPPSAVVLGGSFAHGACVAQGKSMVAVLREHLPNTLNLASDGAGPMIMLAILSEFGPVLRPKTIVWINMADNEFDDLEVELRSPLLRGYLEGTAFQDLAAQQDLTDDILRDFVRRGARRENETSSRNRPLAENVHAEPALSLVAFWKLTETRKRLGLARAHKNPNFKVYEAVLRRSKDVAAAWGGRIVFVNLPYFERYRAVFSRPFRDDSAVDQLLGIASKLGFDTLDARPAFDAHVEPRSLFTPFFHRHYNEAGHRLAGEAVWKGLAEIGRD